MTKQRKLIVTIALFIATFMSAIEGTIVTTAMPTIISSLDGLSVMNWVFSIYLLMSAIMTPIYGKLADLKGRKIIFIIGILFFIIGSSLCGLSQSMEFLIFSRAIQGIGAGSILPLSLTIIADLYTAEERANIMGLNNAAWGIASIIAPLLGGMIVQYLNWHWIFLINVPIGIIVIGMVFFGLKENRNNFNSVGKLDIKGAALLMIFLLLFLYTFQLFGDQGFKAPAFLLLIISVIILLLFIRIEKVTENPIISPKLFNSKSVLIINCVTLCVSGFLTGIDVYTPMWLQTLNGSSATLSGLALAPMSIFWMVGSFLAGKLLSRLEVKKILLIGSSLLFVSTIIYSIYPISTPYFVFCIIGVLLGIGFGMSITTSAVAIQESVETKLVGSATSLNTLFRTLGQSIMVAIYGTVLNMSMNSEMTKYPQIHQEDLNRFMNVQEAHNVPTGILQSLRSIMYNGLHHIFITSVVIMLLSLVFLLLWKAKNTNKNEKNEK